jgi:hypothetical protein
LFKGELSLNDILYGMTKKEFIELREARIKRLQKDQEEMRIERERLERSNIRNQILRPDS